MYREGGSFENCQVLQKCFTLNIHLLNTSYSATTAITNKYDHLLAWNPCWNLACKFPECCSFALEKRKEVGGLLKPFENWAQGGMNSYHWAQGIIDFLHNGSQVLHLTPWVVGGWKCIPRCSFNLKYLHSQPLHSGEGWEAWGAGVPTFLNVLRPLLLTYLLIPLRGLGLTFLIFSGQMPKAPLFRPGSQG